MFKPETQPDPITTQVITIMDEALQAKVAAQVPRQYLGASAIGGECDRQLAYSFHMTPKDEGAGFRGNTLRMFDMGHDGEERMSQYIKAAGFDLQTHTEDGKQIAMSDADGKFKGHLDGVIHGGPVAGFKYPMLWENKALGSKTFSDFKRNGLKEFKLTYYAQVQIYMGYHDLESCLFTALNRDTGEVWIEIVKFNARDCQHYIDRAVRIVKSSTPDELGKAGRGADDFKCKFCDYKKRCHSTPTQAKPATDITPDWLR
jgi:hypothetical protein